jgi:phospholipid/cholesterol/gamma-HCH transport system substrate-binding protein
MLLRGMPRLERILKDLETFSDKLARHPELLGVRGAVRPSEGLKEPPRPYNQPIIVPGP